MEQDPGLLAALLALVHPTERGCPMSPLRWTCVSLGRLTAGCRPSLRQANRRRH